MVTEMTVPGDFLVKKLTDVRSYFNYMAVYSFNERKMRAMTISWFEELFSVS